MSDRHFRKAGFILGFRIVVSGTCSAEPAPATGTPLPLLRDFRSDLESLGRALLRMHEAAFQEPGAYQKEILRVPRRLLEGRG